jgi:hypothetical protein
MALEDSGSRVDAGAETLAPAIARTLRDLHDQRLDILAPDAPPQRLAFGVGHLLQASGDKVVLRDTTQGDALSESNIGSVLATAHGSDGAVFALGVSGGVRFEAHAKSARAFPRAAFFPGSVLFPDLEQPSQFYVFYPVDQQLFRYPFQVEAGAFLPIEATIPLEGCVGAPAQLPDEALVCRTKAGLSRKAPRGRRTEFESSSDLGQPFRLLPAKRLDELFAVDRAGVVKHVRLAAGLPVLATFRLPALPYAAVANGDCLAFVLMSAPEAGKERTWSLLVTDFDGQPRLRQELSAQAASADENWAEALVADKNLAISKFEPLVVVGGAARVVVWDYREGRERFAR